MPSQSTKFKVQSTVSTLILDQRPDVVTVKLLSPRQKLELNDEHEPFNCTAESFNQVTHRFCGTTGGEQIVGDDDAVPVADRIPMDFQSVLAVFEVVRNRRAFGRQL